MTTSFITDQLSQELSLDDMKAISGGVAPLWVGVGFMGAVVTDQLLEHFTGKGLSEHWNEGVLSTADYVLGSDSNVAPREDGKGCTDRGLPL